MRYLLNENLSLCGWKKLPFALMDADSGKAFFFNKKQFKLLFLCSGKKDIDLDSLDPESQTFFEKMLDDQAIREAAEGETRDLHYTEYQGIYKESVQWSITGKCNYRCRHCFQSAPDGVLGEPNLEQCLDVVAQLDECGIKNISLTGGEPLIRDDLFTIIDEILRRGMKISTIYSNGFLVTDTLLDELEKRALKPSFQISFDGAGYHDWMRGIDGAEEIALDAIRLLSRRGFRVSSAMCLFRENLGSMRETVKVLAEAGCSALKFQRAMPQGEWEQEEEHYLSYDEVLQAYLDFLPAYKDDGMPLDLQMEGFFAYTRGAGYSALTNYHLTEEQMNKLPPCGIIHHSLYIGPNGAVTPCMSMCGAEIERQFPNLYEMPLKDILTDSSYTKLTSVRMKELLDHNAECRTCEKRTQCCGGCRAFAVGASGIDYLGIDPITCKIIKEGWTERLIESADKLFERRKRENVERIPE